MRRDGVECVINVVGCGGKELMGCGWKNGFLFCYVNCCLYIGEEFVAGWQPVPPFDVLGVRMATKEQRG